MEKDKFEETHEKGTVIIVNGKPRSVTAEKMTFDELVNLAYNNNPPSALGVNFVVTYQRVRPSESEGSLVEGQSIEIEKGMIFDVYHTDNS